ncbi:MAG: type II toxin-antitoxin system MqsA family antitoxin [Actinobacteria bacterium]|nr:type II toxin-antitoxin system MqsA family antitoxin [Actinomycetota bacterium]
MDEMRFPLPEDRKKYPSCCDLCGGTITEKRVDLPYPDRDGTIRLIRGAPAGVCDQCHEKYLTAETAQAIDKLLAAPPSREEKISVWEFAKAG